MLLLNEFIIIIIIIIIIIYFVIDSVRELLDTPSYVLHEYLSIILRKIPTQIVIMYRILSLA
jgi:hypothetical protein